MIPAGRVLASKWLLVSITCPVSSYDISINELQE